jgi:hypothetical protein
VLRREVVLHSKSDADGDGPLKLELEFVWEPSSLYRIVAKERLLQEHEKTHMEGAGTAERRKDIEQRQGILQRHYCERTEGAVAIQRIHRGRTTRKPPPAQSEGGANCRADGPEHPDINSASAPPSPRNAPLDIGASWERTMRARGTIVLSDIDGTGCSSTDGPQQLAEFGDNVRVMI